MRAQSPRRSRAFVVVVVSTLAFYPCELALAQGVGGILDKAIKALTDDEASKEAAKSDEGEAPVVRRAAPVDPELLTLTLSDGSTVNGKLDVKQIELKTSYGALTIPLDRVVGFTPGLDSRSKLDETIRLQVEKLGSDQFTERELAKQELIAMGPPIRDELQRRLGDKSAASENSDEQKRRASQIKVVLKEIGELEADLEEDGQEVQEWGRLDTVRTAKFTVTGKISPTTFVFQSKFGPLTVELNDIRQALRPSAPAAEIRKAIDVDGAHVVQKKQLSTKIEVKRGDRIVVQATGSITMSPWGSNYQSGPNGDANQYGTYRGTLPGGALIGRIGSGDKYFLIGANHQAVAESTGVLHLAIAMDDDQAQSDFPGKYSVRIRVIRK